MQGGDTAGDDDDEEEPESEADVPNTLRGASAGPLGVPHFTPAGRSPPGSCVVNSAAQAGVRDALSFRGRGDYPGAPPRPSSRTSSVNSTASPRHVSAFHAGTAAAADIGTSTPNGAAPGPASVVAPSLIGAAIASEEVSVSTTRQ